MKKRPNILFILSDQHNPEVLGAAGDPYIRTPNIDALTENGVFLKNCYCASPLCVPSRAAMLSGLLPSRTGVFNNMQALPSDKATFVHALALDGYETVLSGRMHFVGWDQRHGFQRRLIGDITASFMGIDNEEEIYGDFKRTSYQCIKAIQKSGGGSSAVLQFDRQVTNAAIAYLKARGEQPNVPLFMVIGLYGPHCPYIAPPELFEHYYRTLPEIGTISEEEHRRLHPAMRHWREIREISAATNEDVRRVRAAYYGMVEYMDGLTGDILNTAESVLDMENTIIIYGSDHGDNIGAHGLFWKTNFYEGAGRVPLIFSWKNHFQEGKRLHGATSLLDLAPTLLEISGGRALPDYDGIALTPYLTDDGDIGAERQVFAECSDIKGDPPSAMLRAGRYKLICHAGYEQVQLFDLEADPGEENDLGAEPEYRDIVAELLNALKQRWDPEQAVRRLEQDQAHFRLVGDWMRLVKPDPIEEWRGRREENYLV